MLDGERFRHHRTDTAGTGKSREGHQQVAEQWEHQFHAEGNSNGLSTVASLHFVFPFCQNLQFATHTLAGQDLSNCLRGIALREARQNGS